MMAEDSGSFGLNKDHWDNKNRVATEPKDLNPLVAKYVMDLKVTLCGANHYPKYESDSIKSSVSIPIPNYAAGESIWDVVEKCLDEGFQLNLKPCKGECLITAEPFKPRERRRGGWSRTNKIFLSAPTAPIAYCLAALWAVGIEVEYRPEPQVPKVGETWTYIVGQGMLSVLLVEPRSTDFPLGAVVYRPVPSNPGSTWLVTLERFLKDAKKV